MSRRVSGSRSRRSNWRSRSSLLGVTLAVPFPHDVDVLVGPAQPGAVAGHREIPARLRVGIRHEHRHASPVSKLYDHLRSGAEVQGALHLSLDARAVVGGALAS